MAEMKVTDIITKCGDLKKFWSARNTQLKEWYKQIQMYDEFEQENMESFVSNDPRAAYNLTVHMLNQKIPHRIKVEELDESLMISAAQVKDFYTIAWTDIFERYRLRGKQSFLRDLIGLLVATGWYSVFATVSPDGTRCMAEILNPACVYPSYDDVLTECAHIEKLSESTAKRMLIRNQWTANIRGDVDMYDYWWIDTPRSDGGYNIFNAVVMNQQLVKPPTLESNMRRIPIFVAPAGGLPDTGFLSEDWIKEIGQPSIATNSKLFRQWNKWWTFQMQILRDTAQPKVLEKSRSTTPIVKKEDMSKRGVIWRGSPEDSIDFVSPPPLPLELRSALLDMEAMKDRGGPSAAMYGATGSQMTSFMMSQVTHLTAMMVSAYHEGVIHLLSDIDNFWAQQIKDNNYSPYEFKWPKELPNTARVSADYEVKIPGDIAN